MKPSTSATRKSVFLFTLTSLAILLSSCKGESQPAVVMHEESFLSSAIHSAEQNKAASLIVHYFGGELKIQKLGRGPAGSIRIDALSEKDSATRTLYMLPDQQHVIEGTLYSPHMTREQITSAHSKVSTSRAQMKTDLTASKEEMRNKISNALKSGRSTQEIAEATRKAVNDRVSKTSSAKRQHNETLASSLNVSPPLKTASLPRVNSVVDKEKIYEQIEDASWISEGTGEKVMYVFYDLKCPACLEVHGHLKKYVDNGELQVRYLPVGALGPDSLIRASLALMPTKNESRLALLKRLSSKKEVAELIKDLPAAPEETQRAGHAAALRNLNILVSTQRVATPTFAYRVKGVAQIAILTSPQQLKNVVDSLDSE